MSTWPLVHVGELVASGVLALNDGYRVTNAELGITGVPFVRGGDIGAWGDIDTAVKDHVLPEFADRIRSKLTRAGDVAFITKGTVGRVGFLREDQPAVVFAPQVCYWRSLDKDALDPRFIFYLLSSHVFQSNLDAVKTHGAMAADYVSLTDQRHFRLPIPPIREQRIIARILGALDDKIALNRNTSDALEAMASALFKSWFVDFDPVRAKIDGLRPEGLDAETAALFPDSLQESALGMVPKGWRHSPIGDVTTVVGGSTPGTQEPRYWGGRHAWVTPKDLSKQKSPLLLTTDRTLTDAGLVSIGSGLLPSGTVLLSSRAPIGYRAIARTPVAINQGFIALVCNRELGTHFVYHWLERELDNIKARAGGTTFPEISKQAFRPMLVLAPEQPVLRCFESRQQVLFDALCARVLESETLRALRDALLPKLMSGELRVPEAA
jgi:type I restriction enzyme S subunit